MPRITKPLSDTEIRTAKPREKIYNLSDGDGLQLRVKPSGSKTWVLDYYKPYVKKRTTLGFGRYPEVSLADARKKRESARSLLAKDIDPKEHREEQRRLNVAAHNNTLSVVTNNWLDVKKSQITEGHAEDIERSFKIHIFPTLGDVPIHKITATMAIETIKPVAAKGSLETVKRLCQRVNEVMIFALNTGLIEQNTLTGINKAFNKPRKQHLPTIKPQQLPELMQALSVASIKLPTRCLIEWQLHTMTRPSEAAGARWDEIDTDTKLWKIPAERMKGRKPHTIPLTCQSLTLLKVMHPISHRSEFIFPSDRSLKKHINNSTANMALKRMGFRGILVSHGLRALASTTLNECSFEPDVIEAALAHTGDNEVRNAYNRAEYLERRTAMMNWWSEHIEKAATGKISLAGALGISI